jgi:hypothetical protein
MFKKWVLILYLSAPILALAQYEPVPRSDDPFVFCTQGPFVTVGWTLIGRVPTPWPFYPPGPDSNFYLWLRVCIGYAQGSWGTWDSRGGVPHLVPTPH